MVLTMVPVAGDMNTIIGGDAAGYLSVTTSRSPIQIPGSGTFSGPSSVPIGSDGWARFQLPVSNDPSNGEAWTYTITAYLAHTTWVLRGIEVPAGTSSVDLSDPPSGIVREYPTRQEWQALIQPVVDAAVAAAVRAEFAAEEAEATILVQGDWAGAVDLTALAERPNYLTATLTGDVTVSLPAPGPERAFTVTLDVTQDATGGRTLSLPGVASAWAVGIVPHPDPATRSIIHLMWTGSTWVGMVAATNVGIPSGGGV